MPKFMFIFRGGGYASSDPVSPTELQAHLGRWNDWTNAMLAAGRKPEGQPLSYPPTGTTLRGKDKVVTDGPYAESKDLVSGTVVIEAATLAEATEWARGCPIFERDGSVEVRPVLVPPGA
ncbi:MAG: YciI family protein [Deltaproteobacteria bacterium]|nr:YciI family protein [Deltaproteobacteria bacterium]